MMGIFFTQNQMLERYNLRTNFLELLQIRQSLPFQWRNLLRNSADCADISRPFFILKNEFFPIAKLKSKDAYQILINANQSTPACVLKWQELSPNFAAMKGKIFKRIYSTSRETRLQSFQYSILHRIITCKKRLSDMRIIQSNICDLCPNTVDSLSHFFIECTYVHVFWTEIKSWLNIFSNDLSSILLIDWQNILFGIDGDSDTTVACNYIIIYAKYFIYRHRVQGDHRLIFRKFQLELRYKLSIERAIARKNKTKHFDKFLLIYENLLSIH